MPTDLAVVSIDSWRAPERAGRPENHGRVHGDGFGLATPVLAWTDSVFLSDHDNLEMRRAPGPGEPPGAVAAGGSYSENLTAAVPPMLPGAYRVVVEADSRGLFPTQSRQQYLGGNQYGVRRFAGPVALSSRRHAAKRDGGRHLRWERHLSTEYTVGTT